MEISKALRFVRKKLGLTQKELCTNYIDRTAYSRIESGERPLKISDLREILKSMSIDTGEFFSITSFNEEQQDIRLLFYHCGNNLSDITSKNQLLLYYEKINAKENKTLLELSNYIGIKNFFHQHWEEIEPLSQDDIFIAYEYLTESNYFFQIHYILMTNIIAYLSKRQGEILIKKGFPIKDLNTRNYETRKFAYNTLISFITSRLYDDDFEGALKYIEIGKLQEQSSYNYSYRLNLQYLDNLTKYLSSGDHKYFDEVVKYIDMLESIGDTSHAKDVSEELKALSYYRNRVQPIKRHKPIGLIREG